MLYVNHLQGQSVICVAFKTPLEITFGICPPIFYNKNAPILRARQGEVTSFDTHGLFRLKVNATLLDIFTPRGEPCETATAQLTPFPFADDQGSVDNSFLIKRIITKTHSSHLSGKQEYFIETTKDH